MHTPFSWILGIVTSVFVVNSVPAALGGEPVRSVIGVTSKGTPIGCLLSPEHADLSTMKVRVLLISSNQIGKDAIDHGIQWFHNHDAARSLRERFAVSAVPCSHPDQLPRGLPRLPNLPKVDGWYHVPDKQLEHSEEAYLWRWIGMHGPDFVVEVRSGDALKFHIPKQEGEDWVRLKGRLKGDSADEPEFAEWVTQLAKMPAGNIGTVPAFAATIPGPASDVGWLVRTLEGIGDSGFTGPSSIRKELLNRGSRSPKQVAEELAKQYGFHLQQVAYIPALPLVAKVRLCELTGHPQLLLEVLEITDPFLKRKRSPVPRTGSEQAGHLIFAELASRAADKDRERWTVLCKTAADQVFDKDGKPQELMPFHNEMSDAVFMAGPILAATGKLTGEMKYFDAATSHFASMRKLCLRDDGIYRHSPLCDAAWGRGNGFPALGLAWALSEWPDAHPAKKELTGQLQKHLAALKEHQDQATGCWHQVIDHPESYDEYSCTCMIGWAMQRGISRGWLSKDEYQPCVDLAWRAIKERTSPSGELVNVCTGTGKQKTLQDYFDRPAINGRDDRGGAMGLLFATELLAVKKAAR